jgi:hypothetical protein
MKSDQFKVGQRVRFKSNVYIGNVVFRPGTIDRIAPPALKSNVRTEMTAPFLGADDGWIDPDFLEPIHESLPGPEWKIGDEIEMVVSMEYKGVKIKEGTITTIGGVDVFGFGDNEWTWTYAPLEFANVVGPNNGWGNPKNCLWKPSESAWRKSDYAWLLTAKPGTLLRHSKTGETQVFMRFTNSLEFAKDYLACGLGHRLFWHNSKDRKFDCEGWAPIGFPASAVENPTIRQAVRERLLASVR